MTVLRKGLRLQIAVEGEPVRLVPGDCPKGCRKRRSLQRKELATFQSARVSSMGFYPLARRLMICTVHSASIMGQRIALAPCIEFCPQRRPAVPSCGSAYAFKNPRQSKISRPLAKNPAKVCCHLFARCFLSFRELRIRI